LAAAIEPPGPRGADEPLLVLRLLPTPVVVLLEFEPDAPELFFDPAGPLEL
jgi:hypothetical protein